MGLFIFNVITHTPLWVWGLLAALIALGLMQARDRVVPRPRVWLQPVLLGAWSLWSASSGFGWHATVQPAWLAGFAFGMGLNRVLMLPQRLQPMADGRVAIGASWAPLILILAIFTVRYVVNASLAVMPQLVDQAAFVTVSCVLYGLPSGLLAARALRALQAGRSMPAVAAA